MTTAKKDKIYKITIFKTLDIRKQRTVVSQRLETNEVGHRTSQEYYLKMPQATVWKGIPGVVK